MAATLVHALTLLLAWPWPCLANCPPSLADLALQKVLRDSSQVFGDLPAPGSSNSSTAEWMKGYADSTLLVHMNIPGTHESATWNLSLATVQSLEPDADVPDPAYYRCQNQSLAAMLEAGIRFFDLRYAIDPTFTTLVFWHSNALMSETATLEDVLFGFYAWLDHHPSETVILSMQYEGSTQAGASNDAAVQQLLFSILTSPAAQKYILQTKDQLGTLGEARGKVILFRRFDLSDLPASYEAALPGLHFPPALWTDDSPDITLVYNSALNLTAYIEDYYEPDDLPVTANASINILYKLNATTAHLTKAVTQDPDSLFITFASAEHIASLPPVFPETMALGNGTEDTPLGGVNQQLVPFLQSLQGKRLGIVVLDYFGEPPDLVETILGL